MIRILVAVVAMFSVSCSTSMVPRTHSRDAVVDYVNRAAELVADSGAAACSTFRSNAWYSGEWYIFVFDESGRTACHPARPDMVGTVASQLMDTNGVRIGDEFMRVGSLDGGGWVDYHWARPGSTAPVAKSAYVRSVMRDGKRYIVGSGGYEMRP
jgi:methyl-accepting chemotaxis protein